MAKYLTNDLSIMSLPLAVEHRLLAIRKISRAEYERLLPDAIYAESPRLLEGDVLLISRPISTNVVYYEVR